MENLARANFRQRSLDEAESLYRRALEIFERIRGANDPKVADVLLSYAAVLRQTGRKADGKKLEARARAMLVTHSRDSRLTVDVSDLLPPGR